jgi:predicted nucleic acid-binding protein
LGEAPRIAANLGLRGADAIYVAVAEQLRLPLITWDNEQEEKAKTSVDVRAPQ